MKRILCIFSTTPCDQVGLNDNILALVIAQRGQLNQLLSADFQLRIPTLSQWLGSFPTESRAEIFPQYRQDCPLPPPINRGGFNGQKKGENRVQSQPKNLFSCRFLHIYYFFLSPPWPSATTTLITGLPTIFSSHLQPSPTTGITTARRPPRPFSQVSHSSSLSFSSSLLLQEQRTWIIIHVLLFTHEQWREL